jgi:3-hydroxyisobutyrate dehydrogenase-like beta-hydroxyacid dehydrogenase
MGLGAMGGRMAARLLDAGHPVTVWNRSYAAGHWEQSTAAVS